VAAEEASLDDLLEEAPEAEEASLDELLEA
jgi:hypothetical protein